MTFQTYESIFVDGVVRELNSYPLCDYFDQSGWKPDFLDTDSSLQRGYQGSWEIKEGRLYLIGIEATLKGWKKATIEDLFPQRSSGVFAFWYTGELILPQGKVIEADMMSYAIHESDLILTLEKGMQVSARIRINSTSSYCKSEETDRQKEENSTLPRFDFLTEVDEEPLPSVLALSEERGLQLMQALRERDLERARLLLTSRIDVNAADARGVTPIMVAAYLGYADICQRLLDLGANLDIEIHDGEVFVDDDYDEVFDTPLTRAHSSRNQETIAVIETGWIKYQWKKISAMAKSDPNGLQYFGGYQLTQAAQYNLTQTCVDMIQTGVDVNHISDHVSALENAIQFGHFETAMVLCALGANTISFEDKNIFPQELICELQVFRRQIEKIKDLIIKNANAEIFK